MDDNVCYIKAEFKKKPEILEEQPKEILNEDRSNISDEPQSKKRKKERGRNKSRPIFKESLGLKLCKSLSDGILTVEKCDNPNCRFTHDLEKFMMNKPDDIGETCYIYNVNGFCQYGVTCRFAKNHLDLEFKNIRSEGTEKFLFNSHFPFELQNCLRKKKYDFTRADGICNVFELNTKKETTENLILGKLPKPIGYAPDIDTIKERAVEKKKVDFRGKLLLSPLTTVGNLPFRRICKEYGADITCGEMACCIPLLNGLTQEWALTKRHKSEDIFGVQICGHNANIIAKACQVLTENIDVDFIDLNIGCPIDLIFQQGAGSALLRRDRVLESIVRSASTLLNEKGFQFTVKTRTGIQSNKSVAHVLVPQMEKWGASAVTLHGRSKEQRYSKLADWSYIQEVATKVSGIPVIGNGDIMSYEDYLNSKKTAPSVSSVMLGRGALIKPWIFKEIKDEKPFDISGSERFEMLRQYVNYGLEHWGSDTKGVETTRRFFLEFLSFLYRYVPYGILERPPQRINQRPESDCYLGRDDFETLMASRHCSDWIKLSEMAGLGPVPDGYVFLPKHKANSY